MRAESGRDRMEHEQWATVLSLLDTMDYDLRAVFVLHELEGMTVKEIAEDLEITLAEVEAQLREAHALFEIAVRRRQVVDQARCGARATVLPLSPSALLRVARAAAPQEISAEVRDRVWAGIQQRIASTTSPRERSFVAEPQPSPRKSMDAWTAFVTGLVAGVVIAAMGLSALRRPPPPPPARPPRTIPIPVEDGYIPAGAPALPARPWTRIEPSPGLPSPVDEQLEPRRALPGLARAQRSLPRGVQSGENRR